MTEDVNNFVTNKLCERSVVVLPGRIPNYGWCFILIFFLDAKSMTDLSYMLAEYIKTPVTGKSSIQRDI